MVGVVVVLVVGLTFRLSLALQQDSPYATEGLRCDFEEQCRWKWNTTIAHGFKVVTGQDIRRLGDITGPVTDADNSSTGHFLILHGSMGPHARETHIRSPKFMGNGEQCHLNVALHMATMQRGNFKVVVESLNHTSWVVNEIIGNDNRSWMTYNFNLGQLNQEFSVVLEVVSSGRIPSHLAMDNIKLFGCFPEPPGDSCEQYQFHCDNTTCIQRNRVCDITPDCLNGEDEEPALCEDVPDTVTRCTFEDGWCGWSNILGQSLNWTLHNGSSTSEYTGPNTDHTYKNATGVYMYVNMSKSSTFAEEAVLQSPLYYPPPPFHSNASSPYYKSCEIRFWYHQFVRHKPAVKLYLVELDKKQNHKQLWRIFGTRGKLWYRISVTIPNVTERYFLRFEARRGIGGLGDIAIDDISMSPECFGKGVPANETVGYNYSISYWHRRVAPPTEHHPDFTNRTYYYLNTCGAKGRRGPLPMACTDAYNQTSTRVTVLSKPQLAGVQEWVAPEEGYYTIIAKGASGGLGYDGNGSSYGAVARIIVELHKGQRLYVLVGQEGTSAYWKELGRQSSPKNNKNKNKLSSGMKDSLSQLEAMEGGGGGGGASFVFFMKNNNSDAEPVLIAAGGGGIGQGTYVDDGRQHGHALNISRQPVMGIEYGAIPAGAGGGWRNNTPLWRNVTGQALLQGGLGGRACNQFKPEEGTGGFGGGGSGCKTGGGGGGYSGGNTWTNASVTGEGGYSFVGKGLLGDIQEAGHDGPGAVYIIPAISGCQCDYRCVALDEFRHSVQCLCPDKWILADNNASCIIAPPHRWWYIICIASAVVVLLGLGMLCIFLWMKKYANKKKTASKILFGNLSAKDQEYYPEDNRR